MWRKILLHSFVTDVAYDNINGFAIVKGFDNAFKSVSREKYKTNPVQVVAFINAYSIHNAAFVWRTFGYNPNDLDFNMADTPGYCIEIIGQDGSLVYLGESAGGHRCRCHVPGGWHNCLYQRFELLFQQS